MLHCSATAKRDASHVFAANLQAGPGGRSVRPILHITSTSGESDPLLGKSFQALCSIELRQIAIKRVDRNVPRLALDVGTIARHLAQAGFAIGHSEGTVTGMHLRLARPELAAIVQLCPTVEAFEAALIRQASHIRDVMGNLPEVGDPVACQRNLIDRVKSNFAPPGKWRSTTLD